MHRYFFKSTGDRPRQHDSLYQQEIQPPLIKNGVNFVTSNLQYTNETALKNGGLSCVGFSESSKDYGRRVSKCANH